MKFKKSTSRTVVLGLLALLALCYALVSILERPVYDVMLLMGTGIVFVIVLAVAGLICAGFFYGLRRLFSHGNTTNNLKRNNNKEASAHHDGG